ncbi:MAG: hypothetical protein U0R72_02550 [Nakamurella multipartita]
MIGTVGLDQPAAPVVSLAPELPVSVAVPGSQLGRSYGAPTPEHELGRGDASQ